MKGTALKKQLEDHQSPKSVIKYSAQPSTSLISINKKSAENIKAKLILALSKEKFSQTFFQEKFQ